MRDRMAERKKRRMKKLQQKQDQEKASAVSCLCYATNKIVSFQGYF